MIRQKSQVYIILIISLGIVLRLVQYFYNRGLWMDEASLALNIINPEISLLKPLENLQVAPILFLLIERFSFYLLGPSELALRLFPLLCSLLSLPFAYLFFKNISKDKRLVYIALITYSLAPSLIYYSSEVKQYAVDVLITLVLYCIASSSLGIKPKNLYLILVGGLGIFLSNIAPLIFVTIGVYSLYKQLKIRKIDYWFIITGFIWSILFGFYYIYFIQGHSTRDFMLSFWMPNFMPLNPFSHEFINFVVKKIGYSIKMIFVYNTINYAFILAFIALMLALGIWKIAVKRNVKLLLFIFFPIVLHLLISALKIYPYHLRLVLYLTPFYILIFAFGLNAIYRFIKSKVSGKVAVVTVFIVFVVLSFFNMKLFPYERMESRKALQYVFENKKPDEQFYVNWDFNSAYRYYKLSGIIPFQDAIIEGKIEPGCDGYKKAAESLKGKIWFIGTDVQGSGNDCIFQYLKDNGELLDRYDDFKVHAVLYKL